VIILSIDIYKIITFFNIELFYFIIPNRNNIYKKIVSTTLILSIKYRKLILHCLIKNIVNNFEHT
jgi:hypothetical protein